MGYQVTAQRNHLGLQVFGFGIDIHSLQYSNDIYSNPIITRDIPWQLNERLPLGKVLGSKKYDQFDLICRQAVADGFLLTAQCDMYSSGKRRKKLVVNGSRVTKDSWEKAPSPKTSSKTYMLINGKII